MSSRPPSAAQPTPEEREARIRELRARRRARARKLAIRSGIGLAVLTVLGLFALYWLLTTFGGRDFLLSQIVARLPAGTELTWQRAEGPAAGPLTLHDVRYVQRGCPDKHGEPVPYGQCAKPTVLTFAARRVTIDPDIRPLLGKLLRLDALDVEGATLDLPVSDAPFELPKWPEVLPRIDLPLGLQADTIRVDGFKVTRAGAPLIDVRSLRGGLDARDGKLHAERLVVDSDRGVFRLHGAYDPRSNYRTDLTASALLPAPLGRTRPRLGLVARGDLADMAVALRGHAPAPLRLDLSLHGQDAPRWVLDAASDKLDPDLLVGSGEIGTPLAFALHAEGVGGRADLRGRLVRGDLRAVLQPSKLRVENEVLELSPLVVDVFGGRITARGRGDFGTPADARFKFAVNARDLAFGGTADAAGSADATPAIGADATFGIAGTSRSWAAIGKAALTRDGQRATLDFDGRGDMDTLALKRVHAAMPTGTLDATGLVGWTPALHWDVDATLAGFDPGYFAPDWPGAIRGTLASTGETRDDGGLDVKVEADKLGGTLRGRKLDGRARLAMRGPATGATRTDYAGDIALTVGGSRIDARGEIAERYDVDAKLSPLQLADLLPDAAGALRGTLALSGARAAPNVAADLSGSGLKYGDYAAANLNLKGRLPWQGRGGALTLTASGLKAGVSLDTLRIEANGAVENLRLDAAAHGETGALDLAGNIARQGAHWRGTLASLQLKPAKGASWRLQSPARFAQTGPGWTLSQSCFASTAGGTLCADADWPHRGLRATADALPLALVEPYLPATDDGRRWRLRGDVALDAHVRPAGAAYAGSIELTSRQGGVRVGKRERNELLSYDRLALDASFDARRIEATLGTDFNGGGRIDAKLATGWDDDAPLSGDIAVNTDQLTWMELLSPDIVEPTGKLDGRIRLGGTRAQPTLGGQAQLTGFATEIPSLGIAPHDGELTLTALSDGSARLAGSLRSAASADASGPTGLLRIDGKLAWRPPAGPAQAPPPLVVLDLRGQDVLVSDTRDLRALASPDVQVRYGPTQPLQVSGKVTVPSASLDLERLDQGVSASDDVVVLDPVDPDDSGAATPLELDLTLVMGKDVKLKGFGLDGTLGGQMRVRSVPGREMTALGVLEIGGTYKAYGQELDITRGRLQWSNTPVSDPILDIRAERRIESRGITAGISVSGRASAPEANVWTDPATTQSDALSYLALGRPTSNLSGEEGKQLNAASAALNAGGSLLASQIGGKVGLDDAGIMESRALGGSVLGIGKQLSPRLYVGFGVSLLGTGQVLTLKYLLKKGFDIEIESSTLENRGSINWRKEK